MQLGGVMMMVIASTTKFQDGPDDIGVGSHPDAERHKSKNLLFLGFQHLKSFLLEETHRLLSE